MIHKLCDECGKMESVDFMVAIDDNIYCIECDTRKENEMTEKKYNGWKNRATWNVALHFGNCESLYYEMMRKCRQLAGEKKRWTAELAVCFVRYHMGAVTPDGCHLGDVDWDEIAVAWNDDLNYFLETQADERKKK